MSPPAAIAVLWLGLLPSGPVAAQEQPRDLPGCASGRYFAKPLDLWKAGLSYEAGPRSSAPVETLLPRVALRESVWAQPIRTPDGTWMITVPPRQVLDFLESPSEETARAYLAWKESQTQNLRKAMELLARVKETGAPGDLPQALRPAAPPARTGALADLPYRITYFKRPSCPHCISQDAVLAEWRKRRPSGTLDVVLPGERPELWQAYGVRGTPTLVVELGGRNQKETRVGLQSAEALDAVLTDLARGRDGPREPSPKETGP